MTYEGTLPEPGGNVGVVMREAVFLGVEGGGSKARAIGEYQGRVCVRLEGNGLNPRDISCREFEARLRSLVIPLLEALPGPLRGSRVPIYGYFALAGAGKPAVRRKCRNAVARVLKIYGSCRRTHVTTDSGALVERYLKDREGLVLIAGTGSICVAVRRVGGRRRVVRVGGKGGSLDEGSGYWIGARLVQSVLEVPPRPGDRSICAGLLLKDYGISASEVVSEFPPRERSKVASLAPIILRGYGRRDRFARGVVVEAISDLVGLVVAAAEQAGIRDKADLYLAGGLFMNETFDALFRRELHWLVPGLAPHASADDLTALLQLAKQLRASPRLRRRR